MLKNFFVRRIGRTKLFERFDSRSEFVKSFTLSTDRLFMSFTFALGADRHQFVRNATLNVNDQRTLSPDHESIYFVLRRSFDPFDQRRFLLERFRQTIDFTLTLID